jgi:hypothetical protein
MPQDQGTIATSDPQPLDAEPGGDGVGQVDSDADNGNTDKPYVGSYKTREDAEKGLEEKEKTLRRLQSELDKQKNENKQLALMQQMVETQAKLVDQKGGQSESEVLEYWEKRFEEDGPKAQIDFMRTIEADREADYQAKLAKIREEYDAKFTELGQTVKQYDPDVVRYGDTAKEIAEKMGVELNEQNRDLMIKFAKTQRPAQPERPDLVGTTGTPAVGPHNTEPKMGEKTRAFVESTQGVGKLSKEEVAAIEKKVAANRQSRQRRGIVLGDNQ